VDPRCLQILASDRALRARRFRLLSRLYNTTPPSHQRLRILLTCIGPVHPDYAVAGTDVSIVDLTLLPAGHAPLLRSYNIIVRDAIRGSVIYVRQAARAASPTRSPASGTTKQTILRLGGGWGGAVVCMSSGTRFVRNRDYLRRRKP